MIVNQSLYSSVKTIYILFMSLNSANCQEFLRKSVIS